MPAPARGGYCLVTGEADLPKLTDLARTFDLVIYAMTAGNPDPLRTCMVTIDPSTLGTEMD